MNPFYWRSLANPAASYGECARPVEFPEGNPIQRGELEHFQPLMASPQIVILVLLAGGSVIYAFVCDIRLFRKSSKIRKLLQRVRPELWSELNFFARNWNGGQPGIKLLYRRNVVGLPEFDQQYEQLNVLERKLLWGIVIGSLCIGLVIVGTRFWGWQW
jgi:hypothetical protein